MIDYTRVEGVPDNDNQDNTNTISDDLNIRTNPTTTLNSNTDSASNSQPHRDTVMIILQINIFR